MTRPTRPAFRTIVASAATTGLLLASLTLTVAPPAAAQVLTAAQQTAAAGAYSVDKPHSSIAFTVMHLGITKVPGRFDDFDGKVKVDPKSLDGSSVEFTIKATSVNTANDQRDAHLKTDTFFDTAKYPDITFKSTRISKRKNGYAATGTLTMHGVAKPIVLPFTLVGPVKGMEQGTHLGVATTLTLKRSDFGMTAYEPAVGDEIPITIELDLLKDGSVPPKPAAK